jgi:hypothetical protein
MNHYRIGALARALVNLPTRRDVLQSLAGTGLGLGVTQLPGAADAKRKRRRKKRAKTPKPNAFGCFDVGDFCKDAEQCCSNICEGKQGKRKCKAHDANGCSAGAQSEECGGADVACTTSFLEPGVCGTSTGNAGYCFVAGECAACKTDAECQEADGGQLVPSAACIRCADCPETGGTACVGPFGLPAISAVRRLD